MGSHSVPECPPTGVWGGGGTAPWGLRAAPHNIETHTHTLPYRYDKWLIRGLHPASDIKADRADKVLNWQCLCLISHTPVGLWWRHQPPCQGPPPLSRPTSTVTAFWRLERRPQSGNLFYSCHAWEGICTGFPACNGPLGSTHTTWISRLFSQAIWSNEREKRRERKSLIKIIYTIHCLVNIIWCLLEMPFGIKSTIRAGIPLVWTG